MRDAGVKRSSRPWRRARALGVVAALVFAPLWLFACRWHLSFTYYGSWCVALTMGAVGCDSFDPPLAPGSRWGGHTVDTCTWRFFRRSDGIKWRPTWYTSAHPASQLTAWMFPLWMPAAAAGVLALTAHRRVRRIELFGRCPKCWYDRAGLPAGSPCPECGAGGDIHPELAG